MTLAAEGISTVFKVKDHQRTSSLSLDCPVFVEKTAADSHETERDTGVV